MVAHFYPAYLQLAGRRCVVIGGGPVAEEKVSGLLQAGAAVTVIAPRVTPALARMAAQGRLVWLQRTYRPGDLRGAFLAISAAEDPSLNPAIWQEAEEQKVLLNSVDDPAHCHFIAPAVHRRGPLTVAVSTDGKSPAVAVHVRNRVAALIGPEYGMLAELLGELRQEVAARLPTLEARRALWNAIVVSDVVERLRQGDAVGARRRVREMVEQAAAANLAEPAAHPAADRPATRDGSPRVARDGPGVRAWAHDGEGAP